MISASRNSRYCATFASLAVGAIGAIALGGWITNTEYIKSVVPGYVAMNPLSAVCFLLGGISLWLQREVEQSSSQRMLARCCGLTLVAVGFTKLLDYALQLDLGIDRFMFAAELGDNQMAPNTALCFALSGLTLLHFGLGHCAGILACACDGGSTSCYFSHILNRLWVRRERYVPS